MTFLSSIYIPLPSQYVELCLQYSKYQMNIWMKDFNEHMASLVTSTIYFKFSWRVWRA